MKAKKPFLVIVLTLVLLAVALILPAAASGKQPEEPLGNQPVNWVSSSENSNKAFHEVGWQGGHSYLVKELSDGSVVGHVTFQTMKPRIERGKVSTEDFTLVDPVFDEVGGFGTDEAGNPCVVFFAWFDVDGDDVWDFPAMIVLVDGGEPPKGLDTQAIYLPGVSGWELWGSLDTPSDAVGNIQIHLGQLPE